MQYIESEYTSQVRHKNQDMQNHPIKPAYESGATFNWNLHLLAWSQIGEFVTK